MDWINLNIISANYGFRQERDDDCYSDAIFDCQNISRWGYIDKYLKKEVVNDSDE